MEVVRAMRVVYARLAGTVAEEIGTFILAHDTVDAMHAVHLDRGRVRVTATECVRWCIGPRLRPVDRREPLAVRVRRRE